LLLRCCERAQKEMRRDGGGGSGWWQLLQRHAMPFLYALRAFCVAQARFVDLAKISCWRRGGDGRRSKVACQTKMPFLAGDAARCNFLELQLETASQKGNKLRHATPGCHLDPCQVMQAGSGAPGCLRCTAGPRWKQLKHATTQDRRYPTHPDVHGSCKSTTARVRVHHQGLQYTAVK
jgi:hypothetical protein